MYPLLRMYLTGILRNWPNFSSRYWIRQWHTVYLLTYCSQGSRVSRFYLFAAYVCEHKDSVPSVILFLSYKTISHQRQRRNCFKFCRSVFWHCWLDDGVGVSPVEILHQCTTKVLWKTYVWPGFSWSGVFSRKIGQLNKHWKENCSYLISHSSVVVFTFMKSCCHSYCLCVFVHFRATNCSFVNMRCSFLWHSLWVLERTCLGGSGDWDTVRTDWDGLSEEPGFNSRVGR